MEQLSVQISPPRDSSGYRSIIKRGLLPYFLFGWFALIAPLVPISMIIMIRIFAGDDRIDFAPGMAASLAVALIVGTALLRIGYRKKGERSQALSRGVVMKATVVARGRAFAFYKSARDYTLTVEYADAPGGKKRRTIRSAKSDLHRYAPGDSIEGLCDRESGAVFFPAETGSELRAG